MTTTSQVAEAVRALLYLLPPAIAIVISLPLLGSPFVGEGVGVDYIVIAGPLYLGLLGAPGYMTAYQRELRADELGPRARWCVRLSLGAAFVASAWATAIVGPAWREILPIAVLPVSSTVTSALLFSRFESKTGRGMRE